jgi:hypothetical protein
MSATTASFLKPGIQPDPVPAQPPFIPRILWQTTRDRTQIRPELAACIAKLQDTNPTWEHRLFDDARQLEFLQAVCSERFLRAYARIQPRYGAARADLFRYVAVYLHGGAYLDLKSGTTRPLETILRPDDRFILSQWDNGPDGMFPGVGTRKTLRDISGGEYEQWFVIAQPGHPFLAAVLERVLDNVDHYTPFRFGHGGKGVLEVMGPNAYTRAIHALRDHHPHRKICAWEEGLRYTMFDDLKAHQALDGGHYMHSMLPPLTDAGLGGFVRLRYQVLETAYKPFSLLRAWNYRRLSRRWARKSNTPARRQDAS